MNYKNIENKIGFPYVALVLLPAFMTLSLYHQDIYLSLIFLAIWTLAYFYLKPTFSNLNKNPTHRIILITVSIFSALLFLLADIILDKGSILEITVVLILLVTSNIYLNLMSRGAKLLFAYIKRDKKFIRYYGKKPRGKFHGTFFEITKYIDNALSFIFIGLIFLSGSFVFTVEYTKNSTNLMLLSTYSDNLDNSLKLLELASENLECELLKRATRYHQKILEHDVKDYDYFGTNDLYCQVDGYIQNSLNSYSNASLKELKVKCDL